ncbi:response regulator transcription factor [Devosia rhizoryzae]|uniref:Response regulator n=1 Tax=Devosia rhizoryzae TaxID=2774137 RepID=A0ABX7CAB8_9HYPH|nr:DNA-binding response regulator [Devosia rhizoryzae]QQR40149.1 response regulator [Devosia rhizoryzae]
MKGIEKEQDIVLLVDDSPESLGFLTAALEHDGVTVLVARSGEAALGIVLRVTPDVVLMDAVMPGLDGFETCRQMKAMAALTHVPIIFMTGLTETEHIVHALESGGVDYLSKPINVDELRARIRVHLVNARRGQSARIALDAAGRHLVAFGADGSLLWSTPQANRLLERSGFDAARQATMSEGFQTWLSEPTSSGFDLPQAGVSALQFAYLGTVGSDEYLFRLSRMQSEGQEETLRQQFGLTQRESEVLLWIARGKANRDIGEILGLSPRTVNKHLEQVYAKLGVENRASAAIRAVQHLQSPLD